jgi:hypothetical protein
MLRKVQMLTLILACGMQAWAQQSPASSTPEPLGVTSVPGVAAQAPHEAKPRVEAIVSMRDRPVAIATAAPAHKQSYEFTLKDSEWLDTGVVVAAGEQASFRATGSFTLSDGRAVGPDGFERGWMDVLRQFPLNQAKAGELIGRVSDTGASVPFPIGASSEVRVPTNGKLYLRVNLSNDLTGSGSFKVKVKFAAKEKTATAAVSSEAAGATAVSTPGQALAQEISPELFADIPRRVTDQAGNKGDMVNYALVGTREQVMEAFKAAGWVAVDKSLEEAVLHGILSTLSHEAYTEMPMSTLYLFGRPQDLSFARGDPLKVAAERHHLRVWQTDKVVDGKPLWVGSATHDIGFEEDQRNGSVTHKIDPEIDKEREFLLQSFDAAGVFSSAAYVTPTNPMLKARTATGGDFYSDGRIAVMELK